MSEPILFRADSSLGEEPYNVHASEDPVIRDILEKLINSNGYAEVFRFA